MKILIMNIPKNIKKYYEVLRETGREVAEVDAVAYTTREEAEEEAKRVGGKVVEVVVKNPKKEKKENENIGII